MLIFNDFHRYLLTFLFLRILANRWRTDGSSQVGQRCVVMAQSWVDWFLLIFIVVLISQFILIFFLPIFTYSYWFTEFFWCSSMFRFIYLIFIALHWISSISTDFHSFSLNCIDFQKEEQIWCFYMVFYTDARMHLKIE